MNDQEFKGIYKRFPEHPVIEHFRIIAESIKFHWRNNIPFMKGKYQRKYHRKCNKHNKMQNVWRN